MCISFLVGWGGGVCDNSDDDDDDDKASIGSGSIHKIKLKGALNIIELVETNEIITEQVQVKKDSYFCPYLIEQLKPFLMVS